MVSSRLNTVEAGALLLVSLNSAFRVFRVLFGNLPRRSRLSLTTENTEDAEQIGKEQAYSRREIYVT